MSAHQFGEENLMTKRSKKQKKQAREIDATASEQQHKTSSAPAKMKNNPELRALPRTFVMASAFWQGTIDYAAGRACFRSGEIRVLDSNGNVERTIPFSEADRKL